MKQEKKNGNELSRILNMFQELKKLIVEKNIDQDIINIELASRLTSLSKQTLYHYTSQGKIPFYRSPGGKVIYFRKSELEQWMTSNPVKPRVQESSSISINSQVNEIYSKLNFKQQ